ncbi:aldehyde dehydrogenase family protein [Pseudonocardia nematodicida]|uniref:Aldehyde dehydrogenase family protein n=1 Tax=Pseudonocardia nematodicida TaxID=1206997 RepID=A0ABV1K7J8_9PSEU
MHDVDRIHVGGRYRTAHSSARITLTSPVTEKRIGSVVDAGDADVAEAAATARRALPDWSRTTGDRRAELLTDLATAYDARREEIAALVTEQNGAVITRSRRTNGTRPVALYRHYAERARSLDRETPWPSGRGVTRREPAGVVGAIVPWNAPQSLLAAKLGPALAAGCTVVVKPSPETSLDALLLAELATAAGIPPGVLNVVTGGRGTGAALVGCADVDMVSFTGSTAAGRGIAARCGERLVPLLAELGGKSAAVVLDDADPALLATHLIRTCLPNTGQVCYSCTRLIVPRARFDELVDVATTVLSRAVLGDPADPASDFGPLVSAAQRARVEDYLRSARDEGSRVALGGGRPAGLPEGFYVEPTVLVDVHREMRVVREEIFGPVLVVVPHDGDADAVRIANDSSYGLGGAVFGADVERARAVARAMETGTVSINGQDGEIAAAFQGFKDSAVGGPPDERAYLQIRSIAWPAGHAQGG